MDTALRNRIIGAIVLVALAVIFLPMLVKGPASDSGVADVSTDVPNAPTGQFETRELPLVTPGQPGANGATGMPSQAGQPKQTETLAPADAAPAPAPTNAQGLPLATAGGDYAVSFGAYATQADADIVIDRLRQSGLDSFRQDATIGGKPAWRVRVGPYANRSQAEIARIAALKVRSDVKAEVISLDATGDVPATAASPGPAAPAQTAPNPDAAQLASQAPPVAAPPKPEPPKPAPTPAAPKPAAEPAKPPAAAVPKPAATGVGFALQVGAFGKETDANALRDKLRGNGFSAFVEPVSTDSGQLFRVRVGPVSTRAEADQLKAQVAARNGLTGIVRPHP